MPEPTDAAESEEEVEEEEVEEDEPTTDNVPEPTIT
jgi:hypothetical protein